MTTPYKNVLMQCCHLLGYSSRQSICDLTLYSKVSPSSLGVSNQNKKPACSRRLGISQATSQLRFQLHMRSECERKGTAPTLNGSPGVRTEAKVGQECAGVQFEKTCISSRLQTDGERSLEPSMQLVIDSSTNYMALYPTGWQHSNYC